MDAVILKSHSAATISKDEGEEPSVVPSSVRIWVTSCRDRTDLPLERAMFDNLCPGDEVETWIWTFNCSFMCVEEDGKMSE